MEAVLVHAIPAHPHEYQMQEETKAYYIQESILADDGDD